MNYSTDVLKCNVLCVKLYNFLSIYRNICGFGTLSKSGVPDLVEERSIVDILPLFN